MKCPNCGFEPRDRLLHSPCPNPACGFVWWDTESYVMVLAEGLRKCGIEIHSVLDIGCGKKGVIAQAYWDTQFLAGKYACDRHGLKELSAGEWTPLIMDAEDLMFNEPTSTHIDFVTHCGMLEHCDYSKALRVLRAIETCTRLRCFFTCSAVLREVDYKVKQDGNPFHYYLSWWDAKTFELLGYYVDRAKMCARLTFHEEVVAWFDSSALTEPWEIREARVSAHLAARRCCITGCNAEPLAWDAVQDGDNYYCLVHWIEHRGRTGELRVRGDMLSWLECKDIEERVSRPPGRQPLPVMMK